MSTDSGVGVPGEGVLVPEGDGEEGGRLAHQPLERLVPFGIVRPHLNRGERGVMGYADGHTLDVGLRPHRN